MKTNYEHGDYCVYCSLFGRTTFWLTWHCVVSVFLQRSECGSWVPTKGLVGPQPRSLDLASLLQFIILDGVEFIFIEITYEGTCNSVTVTFVCNS